MKYQRLTGIAIAAVSTLVAQPLWAAPTEITAIQLKPTSMGVELVFVTQGNNRPPIFTVSRGNSSVAEITNTQLRLPGAKSFRQENPAPGITSVEVSQINPDTIRVVVSGATRAPVGQVIRRDGPGLALSFIRVPGTTPEQATTPAPSQPPSSGQAPNTTPPALRRAVAPPVGDITVAPTDTSPDDIDLGTAERIPKLLLRDAPVREVLTLLARAAGLNLAYSAPAQPTAAGQAQPTQELSAPGGQGQGAAPADGPRVSLDIEDEPVQDVFNYVLRLSGLEANRVGRTIFVGPTLPDAARNLVTRTFRLNQVSVGAAASFLTAQGAVTQLTRDNVVVQTVGEGAAARTVQTSTPEVLALRAEPGSGPLTLAGLSVVTDARLNSITLVGSPRKVEIAASLLTQLDLRRRQVSVNVKIVDINLLNTKELNSSFSFGAGQSFFAIDNGAAVFNYGGFNPPPADQAATGLSPTIINNPFGGEPFLDAQPNAPFGTGTPQQFGSPPLNDGTIQSLDGVRGVAPRPPFGTIPNPFQPGVTDIDEDGVEFGLPSLFRYPLRLLSLLRAQITSGNAKILTDPTLVVQEGEESIVRLTQEVFGGFEVGQGATSGTGAITTFRRPIIKNAGLTVPIRIERIDDNGFVSLRVSPTVSAPSGVAATGDEPITLLNERQLTSGLIRLRDGQTLILTGVIQDSDQSTVSKVPILGDIPILGRLFRSTNRTRQRQEVIILLTPQIMDDSDQSAYGYQYSPSPEAQKLINPQPPQQR